MPIVKCDYCGKEINKFSYELRKNKHHYCDRNCRNLGKTQKIEVECDYCGKKVLKMPCHINNHKNHFCSKECANKFKNQKVKMICPVCNKEFFRKPNLLKKYQTLYCSKECYNKARNTNQYKLFDNYAIIIITSKTFGVEKTYIDIEDVEKCKQYTWYLDLDKTSNKFYVRGVIGKNKTIALHRFLMNCPKDLKIDHADCNPLNNRKNNLRLCTDALNAQNRDGAYRTNKSCGLRNVTWDKNNKKWEVALSLNSKRIYIGQFIDLEQANQAAIQARAKYFKFNVE
jgi:endogenous inhibitor of DNA gyrase (YacG/DUF329 family)